MSSSNQNQKPKEPHQSAEPRTQQEESADNLKQIMDQTQTLGQEIEERIIELTQSKTTDPIKRDEWLMELEETLQETRAIFAETGRKWQEKTDEARKIHGISWP